MDAFRHGLQELGYVEGENFSFEVRLVDGPNSQLAEPAAELVRLPVDLLLIAGTAAEIAPQATRTIPIVMVYPADPVAHGLVASLARPGGNVTGVTTFAGQLGPKRLELLRDTVPGRSRVVVLQEGSYAAADRDFQDLEVAAQALGLELQRMEVREPADLDAAFEAAARAGAQALLLGGGTFFVPQRSLIVALAAQHRLPAMYYAEPFVQAGGLMAYTTNTAAQYRRAAYYVDRILKGAKPADLPVEQPMTFEFVVNMKTARELGIIFPREILLQVTEVIEQ
jgi:putative ABC transport system substrate-binding protein